MQTKVMTFLHPLALIRTQLRCVCVCAPLCVCLHSHWLVASACLDQLSVWYLYGSNFSQGILVMVLFYPYTHTHTRASTRLSLSASLSSQHPGCPAATTCIFHRLYYYLTILGSSPPVLTGLLHVSGVNSSSYEQAHKRRSSRLMCKGVWSGTMLWF